MYNPILAFTRELSSATFELGHQTKSSLDSQVALVDRGETPNYLDLESLHADAEIGPVDRFVLRGLLSLGPPVRLARASVFERRTPEPLVVVRRKD